MLQKQHGIKVTFEWTPGHAEVKGNEIADKLAKEAAKEAEILDIADSHITVTKQDIKTAARMMVMKKWQHRWDMSEHGRYYYHFHEKINDKIQHDFPNKKIANIVNNLRSGYCLNDYGHKICQNIDSTCECGERETVEHFVLHCKKYEESRQKLIQELYFESGSVDLNLDLLLTVKRDNNATCTSTILGHFGDFIVDTHRFD